MIIAVPTAVTGYCGQNLPKGTQVGCRGELTGDVDQLSRWATRRPSLIPTPQPDRRADRDHSARGHVNPLTGVVQPSRCHRNEVRAVGVVAGYVDEHVGPKPPGTFVLGAPRSERVSSSRAGPSGPAAVASLIAPPDRSLPAQ